MHFLGESEGGTKGFGEGDLAAYKDALTYKSGDH